MWTQSSHAPYWKSASSVLVLPVSNDPSQAWQRTKSNLNSQIKSSSMSMSLIMYYTALYVESKVKSPNLISSKGQESKPDRSCMFPVTSYHMHSTSAVSSSTIPTTHCTSGSRKIDFTAPCCTLSYARALSVKWLIILYILMKRDLTKACLVVPDPHNYIYSLLLQTL